MTNGKIKNLNLKSQTELILVFNGIETIEQLRKLTISEVKQFKGLGKKGLTDIINCLSEYN